MKKYLYNKADAFTDENSLGNPAACLFTGNETLSEDEMQSIAKQHKGFVSEVVFCSNSDTADCKLVYYSSECEVDFCGHGTIACLYQLVKSNENLYNKNEIVFDTNKKGKLSLYNEIESEDAVYIKAPKPQYYDVKVTAKEIAENLGADESIISKEFSIELIDAGLRTLLVPIISLEKEISLFPCEEKLKGFCLENGIDNILIFSMQVANSENKAHTRVFAPKYGYLEDPATGSGNSAFGYYMLKNNIWDGSPVSLEQGGNDRVFNIVKLKTKDKDVLFGGKATLRIKGEYII